MGVASLRCEIDLWQVVRGWWLPCDFFLRGPGFPLPFDAETGAQIQTSSCHPQRTGFMTGLEKG